MIHVMLVDDNQLILRGLERILDWEANGYLIVGKAINGKQALEKMEKVRVDILFTDIRMPVMDGIELICAVKERYPKVRVIVLSAYDDFKYVRTAFWLGANDYLLKQEYDAETLLCLLDRLKQDRRQGDTARKDAEIEKLVLRNQEKQPEDAQSKYLIRFKQCIEKHYSENNLRAEDVAEYLGISVGWMGKLIYQETALHFADYLNYYRILRAKELLESTNLKVYEIAGRVGYNNVEHFTRVFKKLVGMSPSVYGGSTS